MQDFLQKLRGAVREEWAHQKTQAFLWTPVFLGVGIALYFALPVEPSLYAAFLPLLPALVLLVFFRKNENLRFLCLFLVCVALGFALAKWRTESAFTPILLEKTGPLNITGTLESLEDLEDEKGMRGVLRDVEMEGLPRNDTPRKLRLKFRPNEEGAPILQVGQRISVLAAFNPPAPPNMPHGFDFQRYMYFQGIGALGFAYKAATILQEPPKSGFFLFVEHVRYNIERRISAHLTPAQGGVANALMTGPRSAISKADNEAVRASGLSHMLSISGLHISLLFGVIFFAARFGMALIPPLVLRHPIKKYAALLAMIGAVLYTLISGMSVPTQRSILMMGLVFLAILLDRAPFSLRLIAFSALCVLLVAPESLCSASFQMSFSAVTALIVFYNELRPLWERFLRGRSWIVRGVSYVIGIAMTSVVATFATAPFTLFHFQTLALYSVLANVLAIPVLGFWVMPWAVVAFILMPFGGEGLVMPMIGGGVDMIMAIAHFVAGLEHANFTVSQWPVSALVSFSVAFVCAVLFAGRWRVICVIPILFFVFSISFVKQPDILISTSGDLVALKGQDGASWAFSTFRKDRFTRENWIRSLGLSEDAAQKWPKEGDLGDLHCGVEGCRLTRKGVKLAFLRDTAIFAEECMWADVMVSSKPLPACPSKTVIDRNFIKKNGATALYLDIKKPPRLETAEAFRGARPWVVR